MLCMGWFEVIDLFLWNVVLLVYDGDVVVVDVLLFGQMVEQCYCWCLWCKQCFVDVIVIQQFEEIVEIDQCQCMVVVFDEWVVIEFVVVVDEGWDVGEDQIVVEGIIVEYVVSFVEIGLGYGGFGCDDG